MMLTALIIKGKTMRPMYWFKKRKNTSMTTASELMMDLIQQDKSISIMDAIHKANMMGVTSRSTAHTSLSWLREHGYVKIDSNKDQRVKMCMTTEKAKRYLGVNS